jgi:uncharacterized protein YdhG (YjbR/CyaY superfamily)
MYMSVIEDYLKNVDEPKKSELARVSALIAKAVPDAVEVITYGMPGYKYKDKYLISFGAFKNHMSIFPGANATTELEKELAAYRQSKGTLQFTIEKPLSDDVITKLALLCKARIDNK